MPEMTKVRLVPFTRLVDGKGVAALVPTTKLPAKVPMEAPGANEAFGTVYVFVKLLPGWMLVTPIWPPKAPNDPTLVDVTFTKDVVALVKVNDVVVVPD